MAAWGNKTYSKFGGFYAFYSISSKILQDANYIKSPTPN